VGASPELLALASPAMSSMGLGRSFGRAAPVSGRGRVTRGVFGGEKWGETWRKKLSFFLPCFRSFLFFVQLLKEKKWGIGWDIVGKSSKCLCITDLLIKNR